MIYTTFDSLNAQQGAQTSIEWGGFCRLIQDVPAYPDKKAQPLIKLGEYESNSRASGCGLQQVSGIEIDYDSGAVTPQQAAEILQDNGIQGIVCSTYTSQEDYPKWRLFAPLSKTYEAKHRAALVGGMDKGLGFIAADESYREKQIFFIGRNPESEYTVIECGGKPLDTLPVIQQSARDYLHEQRLQAAAAAQVEAKRLERAQVEGLADGQLSVIDAFNEAYDIRAILQNHGYKPVGKRFVAPGSTSGLPGVVILDTDGIERAYSHHSHDALAGSHAHDAFDCFSLLEHGGCLNDAIKAAGSLVFTSTGQSLTEHNRVLFQQSQVQAALTHIPNNNLKIIGRVARACRVLPDGFDVWAQWAGSRGTPQLWQHLQKQKPYQPGYILQMAQEVQHG